MHCPWWLALEHLSVLPDCTSSLGSSGSEATWCCLPFSWDLDMPGTHFWCVWDLSYRVMSHVTLAAGNTGLCTFHGSNVMSFPFWQCVGVTAFWAASHCFIA